MVPAKKTNDGGVTTEEIRHFDGGREHVWKTVYADGTVKVESKIIYDTEEVEIQETIEETTQGVSKNQQKQLQNTQNVKSIENKSLTQQQQHQQQLQQQQQLKSKNTSTSKETQETHSKQQTSQSTIVQQQQTKVNQQSSQVIEEQQKVKQQSSNTKVSKNQGQLVQNTDTSTTIRTEVVGTKTEPNGDVTTEEVRYFQGGREHTWRTTRADGTFKMQSKTFYDSVEIPCSDEEVEEEEYEEVTTENIPAGAARPQVPPRKKGAKK